MPDHSAIRALAAPPATGARPLHFQWRAGADFFPEVQLSARAPLKAGSQCDRLLAHLTRGRSITPLQALERFGCLTLSQRMGELRRRGHRIRSELVQVGSKRVARYSLEGRRH
jgi:hypothetical protein